MKWESGIYRRTRSQASLPDISDNSDNSDNSDTPEYIPEYIPNTPEYIPFWILELACVEDFFIYPHAIHTLRRNIHRYHHAHLHQPKRILFPWSGSNIGIMVFNPDHPERTIPVPWTLRDLGEGIIEPLTNIQTAMMRAVEQKLGVDRVRWSSPKDISGFLRFEDVDLVKINKINIPKAIAAVSIMMETGERLCEDHLRPDLKYKTDNCLLRLEERDAHVLQERARIAKKYAEITLLPYVTTYARRQCHRDGFYEYRAAGLEDYMIEKCEEKVFHHGLYRYTIPWLGTFQSSDPHISWTVNSDRLGDIMRSTGIDPELPQRWLFIDFETNIVRLESPENEYQQRIYMCGCYRVDWNPDSPGTPPTTRMDILLSTDLGSLEAEARWMEAAAAEFEKATHIFYYAAERGFWKSACKRQGLPLHHPLVGVLDHAIDLMTVIQQAQLFFREAPNQKLKTIGAAMQGCGLVPLEFPKDAGVVNGEDSMTVSKTFYSNGGTLPPDSSNDVVKITLPGPFSYPSAPTVDTSPVPFPKRLPSRARDALQSLVVYNQYDCIILAEMVRVLLDLI